MDVKQTGITNHQAEMIISTYKCNGDVYSRLDTLKSDSNLKTLPFPRNSTEQWSDTDLLNSFTWQTQQYLCTSNS